MYQLFYTKTMSPVKTGDVVRFSGKAWTIDEVCNHEDYLKCWVWVRFRLLAFGPIRQAPQYHRGHRIVCTLH